MNHHMSQSIYKMVVLKSRDLLLSPRSCSLILTRSEPPTMPTVMVCTQKMVSVSRAETKSVMQTMERRRALCLTPTGPHRLVIHRLSDLGLCQNCLPYEALARNPAWSDQPPITTIYTFGFHDLQGLCEASEAEQARQRCEIPAEAR